MKNTLKEIIDMIKEDSIMQFILFVGIVSIAFLIGSSLI